MPDLSPVERRALEAENQNHALRAELARVQAERNQNVAQQSQDRYKQSQVRFRTVFEHSPLGHKIMDADLSIRQANAAVAILLGLASPLELVGRAILEFAHPDYYADWARLQEVLWTHRTPWFAIETCLVRPDGSVLWCRVTSVLFPDESGELGYTTLEDISVRKQLEAQVQQANSELQHVNEDLAAYNDELRVTSEKLQEANNHLAHLNTELDTFVYAAAHDLRSPIINLQGLVQALVEQLPSEVQQATQVEPLLAMMQECMFRFRHTLDRLGDFGLARQQASPTREYVELANVLTEVRQELLPLLTATGGQLVVELASQSGLWFATKHMHSVLLNLVSNGLKYRHPDRAPVIRVHSYYEASRLVVRVQDNGLGLSEVQQGQLFGLFKRLPTHVEGPGVGLYLVKKILDQGGGSIRVESELGWGTTFIVAFPI